MRQRVLDGFERLGEATVGEVADLLGVRPEALYYHVRALVSTGLLVDRGKRPAKRRPESVYAMVSRSIRTDPNENSPRYLRALARMYQSTVRLAVKRLTNALRRGSAKRSGPSRDTFCFQMNARLDARTHARFNRKIEELVTLLREADETEAARRGEGHAICVTLLASPIPGESNAAGE